MSFFAEEPDETPYHLENQHHSKCDPQISANLRITSHKYLFPTHDELSTKKSV